MKKDKDVNQNEFAEQLDDYVDILEKELENSENKVNKLKGELDNTQDYVNQIKGELQDKKDILNDYTAKQMTNINKDTIVSKTNDEEPETTYNEESIQYKNDLKENTVPIEYDKILEKDKLQKSKQQAKETNAPKKITYDYEVLNAQNQKIKGSMDAYNTEEVRAFLLNEGYQVVRIDGRSGLLNAQLGSVRIKISELAFILTQLSTYLKAGIPLIDSIRILEKQSIKKEQKRIFANITYELYKGESFSNALIAQGNTFPKLLINMIKTAEMTGDLPEILDDMTEYYTSIDRTRKQAISAMTYPIIIAIFALIVLTFILIYVIPEFQGIFTSNGAELPAITAIIIGISDFVTNNVVTIVLALILLLTIYWLSYKYAKGFRKTMQTLYMHIPVIKNIIIYKEVAQFTKTFSSLLNHNVFITDSIAILSTVSENEVYKEIIGESLDYLSKGSKISDSFKDKWAFPIVAYEMLVTGENTGRLPMMMEYVSAYYEDLYTNAMKRVNTFIEPVMIILLALIVGVVVLSVVIPMFSFYGQIM